MVDVLDKYQALSHIKELEKVQQIETTQRCTSGQSVTLTVSVSLYQCIYVLMTQKRFYVFYDIGEKQVEGGRVRSIDFLEKKSSLCSSMG